MNSAPWNEKKDWAEATLSELVDHLETTHHVFVKKALPQLTELMTRVVALHSDSHPEMKQLDQLVRAIVSDMGPHLLKEEQILFPAIKKMETSGEGFHCGSIASPIRVMKSDHDHVENLFAEIRQLTKDFTLPEDACPNWRALYEGLKEFEKDTRLHVHKENHILFPRAVQAELK
jgi:regulator of cell morphogenesis and NO signaling